MQAVVSPIQNGWISVYDQSCEPIVVDEAQSLLESLTIEFKTSGILFGIYDDSALYTDVYEIGKNEFSYQGLDNEFESSNLEKYQEISQIINDNDLPDEALRNLAEYWKISPVRAGLSFTLFDDKLAKDFIEKSELKQFKFVRKRGFQKTIDEVVDAICDGHYDALKKLIQNGLSPNTKAQYGVPLIDIACVRNRVEMIKFLIESGAKITDGTFEWALGLYWDTPINEELINFFNDKGIPIPEAIKEKSINEYGEAIQKLLS